MLASTLYAGTFEERKLDFPSQESAVKLFNDRYEQSIKSERDALILAPKFGDNMDSLRYALTHMGFQVTNLGTDQFVTIDMTNLIRSNPSFASERKLSAALFAVGLIMSPGEANGLTEPGFFRIVCKQYSEVEINDIKSKLLIVLKTFRLDGSSVNIPDARVANKKRDSVGSPVSVAVRTSTVTTDDSTVEPIVEPTVAEPIVPEAPRTARKPRVAKTHPDDSASEAGSVSVSGAPTTDKKRRKVNV